MRTPSLRWLSGADRMSEWEGRVRLTRNKQRSGGELYRVAVPEHSNRQLKLLGFERFFQDGDGTLGQDPVQHFAVGIAGNNNDGAFRLVVFESVVNVVGRSVRQFQIEKNEIEFLFLNCGDRFFDGADDHAAEADFFEKKFEKILQAGVVIHHQHGRPARFVFFENIFIERIFLNAPAAADLNGGQLPSLNQVINRREWDAEVFRGLFDGQQVMH